MKYVSFSRLFSVGLMLSLLLGISACGDGAGSGGNDGMTTISGKLNSCFADSIRLYEVRGAGYQPVAAAALQEDGKDHTFEMSLKLPHAGFYMIGDDPRRAATLLLESSGKYTMVGNCQNPVNSYTLENNAVDMGYKELMQRMTSHNQKMQMLMQNMRIFQASDPQQVQRIQADIQQQNQGHYAYLDSAVAKGGILGKVATLYNFKPFMSDPSHQQYGNELEYFRQNFFAGIDLADPEVAAMPQIFEKARAFSATLSQRFQPEVSKSSMDELLNQAPDGSIAYESLLRGYVSGLEQSKSDLFVDYGKQFVAAYPQEQAYVAQINQKIQKMEAMRVGAMAPEIAENTPEGKVLKLSDLRGQYVLIDFWASWCRPCRMENPNVVKAYNKYHKAGFEILGVSLDKDKPKWVQAIAQDKLPWPHVSDLGGWQARPAAIYGVSSIPATVLVDKDGRIAARNLRGPALENKLAEIFGF